MNQSQQATVLRWTAIVFALGGLLTLTPLWVPLLFAAWFAALARPVLAKIRFLGGRHRAAAALTVGLLLGFIVPVVTILVSLGASAVDVVEQIMQSKSGRSALAAVVTGDSSDSGHGLQLNVERLVDVARQYGGQAFRVLSAVAGAATQAVIGLFVFAAGSYSLLVDGGKAYRWLEPRLPLEPRFTRRLADAAVEVGRGLVVSVGLTALAQGSIATIAYLALGIPRAVALGVLTGFASLVPSIGSALVWVPLAAGLAITGRTISALVLVGIGAGVIGTVDNVLRPYLSKYGRLELPMFVVMIAMFGGFAVFGAWGIALGPLLVRLAVEALEIGREQSVFRSADPGPDQPS